MGQKMIASKYRPPAGEEISKHRFDFQYVIGKGGFGKVWKVIDKKTNTAYALKEMQKVKVIDKRSEKSIKYERELLTRLKNSFIVNMYYSFQDYDNLYLVMDLLTGGDLRYHVSRHRRFTEEQTKFFIACIILGFEYIHSHNVIHRDIKPENLVLDDKGYVRITDFGIAKLFSGKNGNETSGTPGYMSPEVMKGIDHTSAVDYFALGVIGYEFMLGRRPYLGKSRKEIKEQMMAKAAYIKALDIPEGWSEEAADFINKLLQRKPEARLGFKGAAEVKSHSWLKHYPWEKLREKRTESPFIPEKKDNYDKRYCESVDVIGIETKARYEQYRAFSNFNCIFVNFTYYGIIDKATKVATPLRKPINKSITPSPSSPNFSSHYLSNNSRATSLTPTRTKNSNKINRSYTNIALFMKSESRNKSPQLHSSHKNNKSANLRSTPFNRRSFNQSQSKQKLISRENTPTSHVHHLSASITSPINYSKHYLNKKKTKIIEEGYLNQKLLVYQAKASSLMKYMRNSSNYPNSIGKVDNKTLLRTNSNYGSLLNNVPFSSQSKSKKSYNIRGDELSCSSNGIVRINQPNTSEYSISNASHKKNGMITSCKKAPERNSASHNVSITPSSSNDITRKQLKQSNSMNYFFKNNKITSISSHSTSSSASNQKKRSAKSKDKYHVV